MATFGRFETVREIHRMGYVVVYSGRASESTADKHAIKVFQPPVLLLEEGQAETEIDLFLKSAGVQEGVAAGGAQHWAPVAERGTTSEGAFYVTDRYDHSLQQLVDVRLKLSSEALGVIIKAVAEGLLELKKARGRPHGNLKATNVLIGGTGDISERHIVLCDPLPDEYVDAEAHWDTDLLAVAEFIYQLAAHRSPPNVDGWQAPDSKEWHRFGRQGTYWRKLCNRLFAVATKPGTMTLEALADDLAQLEKMRPVRSYRRLVAAGVMIVAAAAVALFFVLKKPPPPEKVQWERLCQEYRDWAGALYVQGLGLNKKGGNLRAKRWRENAQVKDILEDVEAAGYPYRVADEEGMTVEYIVDKPYLAAAGDTGDGLAAIEKIKSVLDPNSSDACPLLLALNEAARRFEQRRWGKPAAYLISLAGSVRPEPNQPIAENMDKILDLDENGTLTTISVSLGQIAEYQEAIQSLGDPILSKFDDEYVDREVASISSAAGEDILGTLGGRLNEIAGLGRTLAELVGGPWQTAMDREAFAKDHGNDAAETPTGEVFRERLATIEGYYYLQADPREPFNALISQIDGYIQEAQVSNPPEADACSRGMDELKVSIEEIRAIRPIAKNRQEMERKIKECEPRLAELRDRADRARELPRDYVKRIQEEVVSAGQTDQVGAKWTALRDELLNEYPLSVIERDLQSYSELRRKVDETHRNLVALDGELRTNLPRLMGTDAGEQTWRQTLAQVHERERNDRIARILEKMPLPNSVPDVNDGPFRDFRLAQFSEFDQWRENLAGVSAAFGAIEDALDLFYLLDDDLPQSDETIRSLWQRWKDTPIVQDSRVSNALAQPVARVTALEQIEESSDERELVQAALDLRLHTEAVYAAWRQLGKLTEPRWPDKYEGLRQDREVRQRLRTDFEAVARKNELLDNLAKTAIQREIALIEKNRSGDRILAELGRFAAEATSGYNPSELEDFERLSIVLADYVCGADWQNDEIRKDIFFEASNVHNSKEPVTAQTFRDWLKEVKDYKKLPQDPRNAYSWDEKIGQIAKLIEDELGRTRTGPSEQNVAKPQRDSWGARITGITKLVTSIGSTLTGSAKQNLARLEQEYAKFVSTTQKIEALLALPAIEKNKDQIDANICRELWETLLAHEAAVASIIKPEYCKYLEFLEGETQRLVFAARIELSADFEPINISRLPSATEKKTIIETGIDILRRVKDSGQSMASLATLKELLNKTVQVTDWEQIRQAVNEGQKEWLDFFQTVDLANVKNVGWPNYIVSKKDPSVILRFIPASAGNPEPFYMAVREINNGQYRLFLEKYGAKRSGPNLQGWSIFTDASNNRLIQCTATDVPSCAIKWDRTANTFAVADADADIPVTWVTINGAQAYAQWLGGQLPTVSQHQYACRAGTNTVSPWGNDPSQIVGYAHVRGTAWQKAAEEWNRDKDRTVPPLPVAPIGAVEDYQQDRTLDTAAAVDDQSVYSSAWPAAGAAKPNAWGLYDMIGNVWEWCSSDTDGAPPQICGGSCVAPLRYILLESLADYNVDFNDRDGDVGFRVMVLAR